VVFFRTVFPAFTETGDINFDQKIVNTSNILSKKILLTQNYFEKFAFEWINKCIDLNKKSNLIFEFKLLKKHRRYEMYFTKACWNPLSSVRRLNSWMFGKKLLCIRLINITDITCDSAVLLLILPSTAVKNR
jgi:hypothetical protein